MALGEIQVLVQPVSATALIQYIFGVTDDKDSGGETPRSNSGPMHGSIWELAHGIGVIRDLLHRKI